MLSWRRLLFSPRSCRKKRPEKSSRNRHKSSRLDTFKDARHISAEGLGQEVVIRSAAVPQTSLEGIKKTFSTLFPTVGFGKRGLLEKGSFHKSPFSRYFREFRESRVSREPPDCGKERRFRRFPRDSRESRDFRDSRDFSSEKTSFVMTPFSGPDTVAGDSQSVICKPCSENSWTKG